MNVKHKIQQWLCHLLGCKKDKKAKAHLQFAFGLATAKRKASNMVEVTITNEQKVPVSLSPVTATGKPAKLDPKNPPTWEVQSGDSAVVVGGDGLSAELISSDTPGDTVYLVSADADLGDGVETISDLITLHVEGARAANLGLTAGTPVPK